MTKPDDSAFPAQPLGTDGLPVNELATGLTKREYFAAMAMQGLLANPSVVGLSGQVLIDKSIKYGLALIERLNK
jgi:hypothetical protein